ncbi:inositol monophosphatase [candidate division WWE3 bacterium]|uniref:Inositol-1-monophosphatase n=1 Tax=candidate division WWE3 bacterium TaxID=2053526 RepID=A0A955LL78_UNCKA|nr:inositol monophosphatase [candidate division WWE3 bacterium]
MDYSDYLDFAKNLAFKAGEICKDAYYKHEVGSTDKPGQANHVVTEYDLRIEEFYRKSINEKYPEHGIYGEEEGVTNKDAEYLWALDPIDGTSNFSRNLPIFGTLIALVHNNEVVMGVCYLPILDEMYTATKGGGAFLNDEAIQVSGEDDLSQAYAFLDRGGSRYNEWAKDVYSGSQNKVKGFRILGSCAVQSAWIASGRFQLLFNHGGNLYDFAPGILLTREAGGVAINFDGNDWQIGDKELILGNAKLAHKAADQLTLRT